MSKDFSFPKPTHSGLNVNRKLLGLPEIPEGHSICPRCKMPLADDAPSEMIPLVPRWGWTMRAHEGCAWSEGSEWAPPSSWSVTPITLEPEA